MSFFSELKRRHVVRVALAYVVAAGLGLQVADVVLPILHTPQWFVQVLLASMAAGSLIAVARWLVPGAPLRQDCMPLRMGPGQLLR